MKRICKKCGAEKDIEEFSKNNSCKVGYGWRCKECVNLRKRDYNQRPERKVHIMVYNKVRNQTPERKAKQKDYNQRPERKTYKKAHAKDYNQRPERKARDKILWQLKSGKLTDGYIKSRLTQRTNLNFKDITPEMIELKRELLTFYRLEKELTNGINDRRNKRNAENGKAA